MKTLLIIIQDQFYSFVFFVKKNIKTGNLKPFTLIVFIGSSITILLHAIYNYSGTGNYFLMPNALHTRQYMIIPYMWFGNIVPMGVKPSTDIVYQLFANWAREPYDSIAVMGWLEKTIYMFARIFLTTYSIVFAVITIIFCISSKALDSISKRLTLLLLISLSTSSLITWLVHYYVFAAIIISMTLSLHVFSKTAEEAKIEGKDPDKKFMFKISYLMVMSIIALLVTGVSIYKAQESKNDYHLTYQAPAAVKEKLIHELEAKNAYNLVFVRYGDYHQANKEEIYDSSIYYNLTMGYVYNGPNIDAQKTVFAHDLGEKENLKLISYYKSMNQDRKLWRLDLSGISYKDGKFTIPPIEIYKY